MTFLLSDAHMVTFLCKDDVYKYSSHRVFSKIDTPFQWQIRGWSRTDEHKQFFLAKSDCFVKKTCYICYHDNGPIFLRRFRLYVLSFMFRFMFANIYFEKDQNSKIHVMFIIKHNMKWNMKNQVSPSASYVTLSINMNHNMGFFHG